jgi:hypothetical protein
MRNWGVALLAFSLPVAGCSYVVPRQHVTSARSAIDDARSAGAAESALGRPYLTMAEGELRQAMAARGKSADMLLLRAQVDAELARALARGAALHAEAEEADRVARWLETSPASASAGATR